MRGVVPVTTAARSLAVNETARELAGASLSENTRRAYAGALRRLDRWLDGRRLDDAALAAYLASLYETGRSPAVAGMAAAALRFQMKLTAKPSPVGPATERVLAGFRRKGAGRGRGQGAGVRWEQADAAAAVAANGGGSVKGLRDAALDVADLEAEGGNTLTVRRSKTDQESAGAAQYIGEPTVARVRAWMAAAGIEDGPLFQRLDKAGQPWGPLSTQSIRAIIRRRAQDAGIEGRVSGHSLRVGSAQSLATAGASVVEMQQAGRWRYSA